MADLAAVTDQLEETAARHSSSSLLRRLVKNSTSTSRSAILPTITSRAPEVCAKPVQ
jgi:hypothetical protein